MRSLLRTSHLAELGIPASTAAKLRMRGTGPAFVRVGRAVYYRPEDVDAWLDSQRVRSTAEAFMKSEVAS